MSNSPPIVSPKRSPQQQPQAKPHKRLVTGKPKAWKRRVQRGELAKGAGGAICRHRPRLGRRGPDLILNRKGFIAGGNPKKKKKRRTENNSHVPDAKEIEANNTKADEEKYVTTMQDESAELHDEMEE